MKKKLIRLTEGDVHNMIREAVHKILSEQDGSLYDDMFDKYAYDYDQALENSENIEDFDNAMKLRSDFMKMKGDAAQHYHPQAEPLAKLKGNKPHGSTDAFGYVHEPDMDVEMAHKIAKWNRGF